MTVSGAAAESYGERYFNPADPTEGERLDALAAAFDPASRRHLSALGVGPGWHCLDLGPGAGTIARWLADRVGPTGSVTAIDRDTRFVRRLAHPRLAIRQADIATLDLAPASFDLIHSRMTMMHLREREDVLRRVAGWLRPGGVLLVSDTTNIGSESSAHEAYRTAMIAMGRLLTRTIGTDIDHGRRYPGLLTACGLTRVTLAVDVPVLTAGSPLTRFCELTLHQTRDRMVHYGLVEPETVDRALRLLREPDLHELSFLLCTATGRAAA